MNKGGVLFCGGGEFGSCLAGILSRKGISVLVWDIDEAKRTKGKSLQEMAQNSTVVFLTVCSWHVPEALASLKPFLSRDTLLVLCAKGLLENGKMVHEFLQETVSNPFVFFSGPTIAEDMCRGIPGVAVVSGDEKSFHTIQDLFSGTNISVAWNSDMHSVVWASILKNVYALFIGVVDGAGMLRGHEDVWNKKVFDEWNTLASMFQIDTSVLGGIAGKEDFLATASSPYSLNRKTGERIGKDAEHEMNGEGMHSLAPLVSLVRAKNKNPPAVLDALDKIVLQNQSAKTVLPSLT